MLRRKIALTGALAGLAVTGLWAGGAAAQEVVIPNIIELSGGGATVGAMWRNGATMAVEEINAAGGVLGRVTKVSENYVTLEIASNVEIRVQRPAVQVVLPKGTIKGVD